MMDLKLVIFDMDGLMFNTEYVFMQKWAQAIVNRGFKPVSELFINGMGRSGRDYDSYKMVHGANFDVDDVYRETRQNALATMNEDGVTPKKGLLELLEYLSKNSYLTAIASSSKEETIHKYLEMNNVTHKFDYIIGGDRITNFKPDPEIFLKACAALNVAVENAIVLEDSPNGIKAAKNAGIPCIMVPDLAPPSEELQKILFKVADSLFDVIEIIENLGK
ncbi:HAD family phosphatase [Tyzzerella sp. OttesenSCG-928-J15]|nr:HAD family phosphatase [Tyzzerella sp. OttesenSCG-928-J15]